MHSPLTRVPPECDGRFPLSRVPGSIRHCHPRSPGHAPVPGLSGVREALRLRLHAYPRCDCRSFLCSHVLCVRTTHVGEVVWFTSSCVGFISLSTRPSRSTMLSHTQDPLWSRDIPPCGHISSVHLPVDGHSGYSYVMVVVTDAYAGLFSSHTDIFPLFSAGPLIQQTCTGHLLNAPCSSARSMPGSVDAQRDRLQGTLCQEGALSGPGHLGVLQHGEAAPPPSRPSTAEHSLPPPAHAISLTLAYLSSPLPHPAALRRDLCLLHFARTSVMTKWRKYRSLFCPAQSRTNT